ncbi:ribonucleoside-diphosphate reductase subunit alpha [Salibacterium halotolerans]|uniref:Ribonucleoside-diphosphate reductase n=1 Tax=Salibacterium halotolerans TaxID=1884432 RepID=A0A1I5RR71_9BACI|nr:ribonucleoside-diphosphate reductase subunit alpha [Salibacterium halotolerans]SFP61044.1 ribonucleoside-diphosphate reductase alpha chain [Salibacterium halotolerans]
MTVITKDNGNRELPFDRERLSRFIDDVTAGFSTLSVLDFKNDVITNIEFKDTYASEQITHLLALNASERIDRTEPDWTYVAAGIYLRRLYKEASKNRAYDTDEKYGSLYGLLKVLGSKGVYDQTLLRDYSKEEIMELEKAIDPERDNLFTYVGILTLAHKYLATDKNSHVFELPQERFMIIAMKLMINEPVSKRLELVKEAYWALSNLYMTVATPTLTNAGKNTGQLSSCFIDTVDDSLRNIFDSNTDVANLSKNGGGVGIYFGKLRSRGSDIKGYTGVAGGIMGWMKQLNNTAVSVDQLGQRQGAFAVYLDVWHKDIFEFLDAKLNTGDERLRTHDIFTGACIPDLFMEKVENREDWFLFDPHEVQTVMGWSLEDFYDEKEGAGSFREKYQECIDHPDLSRERVPAIDIMKRIMKSQLETGTPYMFYRDTVNRDNPNKHAGLVYSSNLCTEIMQNMSPTTVKEEYLTEEGTIITEKSPGDMVVCNLSSISLAKSVREDVLERLVPIQVRMLDNVIDLNTIDVLQARWTNERYRAVGLGTFGWHHLLALEGISWETDEAVELADRLYEKINYLTLKASRDLAIEKGAYPLFEGSEWQSGQHLERTYQTESGWTDDAWRELSESIQENGLRNGYLIAVAPNATTSLIAGSTASIDPVFRQEHVEEKKGFRSPVTAPDISSKTIWYYKSAFNLDQSWSIKQNAARQKHIDQAVSFNLYIPRSIKAKDLLGLHMQAWNSGLKTTYYTRSTSSVVEDCESCES